jgi:type III secretory pathway component EscT
MLLAREGIDASALLLGWARAAPAVAIIPAFGLRALPAAPRAVLALGLAAAISPALGLAEISAWPDGGETAIGWLVRVLAEVARGLPVALAAAIPLWAATMAGGVADALRGSQDAPSVPVIEGRATPTGVPLSMLASALFLTTGGPARVASALARVNAHLPPLVAAVEDVAHGTSVAVTLGSPLLAAAVVVETAGALVARAATPAQVHAILAPLRALAALAVLALVFERLESALRALVTTGP